MSCCPTAPDIKTGASGDEDVAGQDTSMRPGESVECYMNRAANTTGRQDDKTGAIPGTIENTDIPFKSDGKSVDTTFQLTANSVDENNDPLDADWEIEGAPSELTVDGARLYGTFSDENLGKSFKITVTATWDGGSDKRGFTIAAQNATGGNDIKFTHPLPGAHVTSPYGPRIAPTTGASTKHAGADFSVKPLPPADVVAAADGVVTFTGFQAGGAGNYIKIKHSNAAGKEMCTTVYMHLATIYVSNGQQVVAGQKIGKEGNTGIGTGPHLHFECRLPNGTTIDPVPLIQGTVSIARLTKSDNTPDPAGGTTTAGGGTLTPANADAKSAGCAAFGEDYPKDPTETNNDVPGNPPSGDPFSNAWWFTMTQEVGASWKSNASTQGSDPTKQDIVDGKIDTSTQRTETGYVNTANYPGGETKFGIAQGPNPSIAVRGMGYDAAKKAGYNNYWLRGPSSIASTMPRTAVMLFDMNYLHGVGNANTIKKNANIDGMSDDDAIGALSNAQQTFMKSIAAGSETRAKYLKGWLNRSNALLAYVRTL